MSGPELGNREVILYEVNEVPWEILDHYARVNPGSNVAALLSRSRCVTTVNDEHDLQPWRTWPTFHKAMYTDQHNSFELGQDPSTFRGRTIWDVAEDAGLSIGVFGALQSWPARNPKHGGFYVPDTFSRTADVYPEPLRRFQQFTLTMTAEQGFSSDAALNPVQMAVAGADLVLRGFTPWSMARTVRQLARERRDARYKAARSIVQALPSFDLFWRLQQRMRPALSVFFTNHVAGMMHRYWGDAIEDYAKEHAYVPDEVFKGFVGEALDVFDHQLGRVMKFVDSHSEMMLVVASSMGQGPIPYKDITETYVLSDTQRLGAALGLADHERGLAMYPRYSLRFGDPGQAAEACEALSTVTCGAEPLFSDIRADGLTASFAIEVADKGGENARDVSYRPSSGGTNGDGQAEKGTIDDLGVELAPRLGGGNTAYHIPEGIYIEYGTGIAPDPSRERMSVLEAAPRILSLLGLEAEQAAVAPSPQPTG